MRQIRFWKPRRLPVPATPAPASFEAALEGEPPLARDPAPLVAAYDWVREHRGALANIGETGDGRDYYAHLDRLAEGVAKTFPESLCKAGCSACCYYPVGLFEVTYTEWRRMREHMETVWSESDREDFARRYQARFTSVWRLAITLLQGSAWGILVSAPWVQRARIACPFLKDDRCSIYAARPYQCRTFGYFAARTWPRKEPRIYACSVQGENLHALLGAAGPQIQLPVMNGLVKGLRRLCRGPRMSLPLWAGIWVRQRQAKASGPRAGARGPEDLTRGGLRPGD